MGQTKIQRDLSKIRTGSVATSQKRKWRRTAAPTFWSEPFRLVATLPVL